MNFLDRLQGKKSVDPMAEVSATAVAHLREQNLKFQKFMHGKVQELEEKVSLEQQRLSTEADSDVVDYFESDDHPAAGDGDKDSESLTEAMMEESWEPDTMAAGIELEPVAETEPASPPAEENPTDLSVATDAPASDLPPAWENLLGLPEAEPSTQSRQAEDPGVDDVLALEPTDDAIEEADDRVEETGASLLPDWRTMPVEETTDEVPSETAGSTLNPTWEAEASDMLANAEDEVSDGEEDGPEMPLPDEVGDWA